MCRAAPAAGAGGRSWGARSGRGCSPGWVMIQPGRTTVTLATATCNSCLAIVGFIVARAKEAKSKMKQRTMVSDTSSTTHFNHSWQKLIQEEFLQGPPVWHVLLLLLLLLFWPKIIFESFFWCLVLFPCNYLLLGIFLVTNRHLKINAY